ncbi:MAG: hypothetical protein OXM56_06570 [Gammaproteobacteria bacterium]|nr:hypothetical protein [Gammaproteobacteria bacterium]
MPGQAPDGPIGTETAIAEPFGVVLDRHGHLCFCDLGNHRIRRVNRHTRRIETIVGTGRPGHSGDGGPALEADIREPYEIRFDPAGDLYFVDMPSHVVRRVAADGSRIDTIAGTGEAGFHGDGGPATQAAFRQPHSIEIGPDGALFVADIGNHRIRRIDPDTGVVETFAGTGEEAPAVDGGDIAHTPLHGPRTLAFDEHGDLYLTLREGNAVYRIDMTSRTLHHVAGTGRGGYRGDGGDAKAGDLAGPKGISVTRAAVYIADTESHTVRRIDRRSGIIATVLGDGTRHDGPDGDPLRCGLARPHGVFADGNGRVFVGDSDNHRVRVLQTP